MKRMRTSFLIATFIYLFVSATFINPAIGAMPLPSGPHVFEYAPVVSPELSQDPAAAKPVGVGPIAQGGNTLSLAIGLSAFEGPVDVYFIIYAPFSAVPIVVSNAAPPSPNVYNDPLRSFYVMHPDKTFESLLLGLVPFQKNVTSALDETVFGNVPTFFLAQSSYNLYLFVTPAGSTDGYYLWSTSFSTYQPVCTTTEGCVPVPLF